MIEKTIRAALDQDYPETEVVVVDNCSTDRTWQVIQELAAKEPRLRAFRNEENLGPVRNWIECARHAQGYFSKILWSDDLIAPSFLSETLFHLDDENVGFVYTAAQHFTDAPTLASPIIFREIRRQIYPSALFIEASVLAKDLPVSPGCAVFRTADLRRNLLLHIPNRLGSDSSIHAVGPDLLLLLLTAIDYKSVGFVDKPLSQFRHHGGSISITTGAGKLFMLYDVAKAYFLTAAYKNPQLQRKFNALLLFHLLRYGGSKLGLKKIADFYPSQTRTDIDFQFLLTYVTTELYRSHLRRKHSRADRIRNQ